MDRYVLKFVKLGNMRFISHLDLVRLFKRAVKRAGIKVAYSNGYNPHELINIVQPLSLGYESTGEYFEIDTLIPYEPDGLAAMLNVSMPEGIKFISAAQIERRPNNLSSACVSALYEAVLPLKTEDKERLALDAFLSRDRITILKKDKKTKELKEKDIKDMIYSLRAEDRNASAVLIMELRCASNETLNPGKLLESLFRYCGLDTDLDQCRITRKELFAKDSQGRKVSVFEAYQLQKEC